MVRRTRLEWAARVAAALATFAAGNDSNVKGLGGGIAELKIAAGPGYRVYVAYAGTVLVILLGGGAKAQQTRDIARARLAWADYKQRTKALRKGKDTPR